MTAADLPWSNCLSRRPRWSAITAATVVLLQFVLQIDSEVRQRTHTIATIGRLAEQFRRDVHQARGEPIVAADHRAAEFHLPGGRIVPMAERRTRPPGSHGTGPRLRP